MIGAKVQLVDKTSGKALPELVINIISPVPSGLLRISLPVFVPAGDYFLRALNGHGQLAAQSAAFHVG